MAAEVLDDSSPSPQIDSLKGGVDANEPHRADLLEQFYLSLQVTYLAAPRLADQTSVVHERIERLFKTTHSWRHAYEIEQLLCFVISDHQLETELHRRLAEAHALPLEHVAVIDKELHQDTQPPADKRIVLHRLLNDLQWFYSKRVQHRSASKRLMVRVSLLFMVALATFAAVLFIQFFAHNPAARVNAAGTVQIGETAQSTTGGNGTTANSVNTGGGQPNAAPTPPAGGAGSGTVANSGDAASGQTNAAQPSNTGGAQ